MQFVILLVIGLAAGVLSVIMGVGGGIIIVPALVFFRNMDFKSATATSLAVIIPTAVLGVILRSASKSANAGAVNWQVALLVSAGAIIGVVAGKQLGEIASALLLKRLFAALMIFTAVKMLLERRPAP